MEDQFEQFIKKLQSVSLTDAEKNTARAALLSHIRATKAAQPLPSPWSWIMYTRSIQMAFLALIIIVGSGSTLSLAAQHTLPGDALYSIKTYVNEPLTRILTVHSPQEYASFETELLNVRLTEAEALDKEERLNPVLTQTIRLAVSEQSAKAETAVRLADGGTADEDDDASDTTSDTPTFKNAAPMMLSVPTTPTSTEPSPASSTFTMTMATTAAPEATTSATTTEATSSDSDQGAGSSSENASHKMHGQVDSKFKIEATSSGRDQVATKLRDVFESHKNILQKLDLPAKDTSNDDSGR